MELKQAIATFFHFFVYVAIIVGVLLLMTGAYFFATICIVGGWYIDQYHFKRWCIGYHYELMEDPSVQTIVNQKAEVGDIIDVEWKEIEGKEV